MKKIAMLLMFLMAVSMGGHHVFSQSVTITLMPGWNWISCPMMDTLDFETAMGSFTPVSGDIVKSRWGQAIYNGNRWMGTISHFYPGYGYMYKSNRTMPVMVTFNTQPPTPQLTVTTVEPTDITATSAISGGSITSNDGSYVFILEKGICWATHPNPMVMNDSYTENGSGAESFMAEMTDLTPNTVYYFRAYAVTQNGTIYGDELSYITVSGCYGNHCYVDLGLPSGLLWATCNVGATEPEEYGVYFAWGETQSKSNYDWSTYQYYTVLGIAITPIKYNNDVYSSYYDNLTTLMPVDDAATINWGDNWRMPTEAEWEELYQNTTHTWTTQNGVNGRLFTSTNGNSIFLPAAGMCHDNNFEGVGSDGLYWSSSLYTEEHYYSWLFELFSSVLGTCRMVWVDREFGLSVRPVHSMR